MKRYTEPTRFDPAPFGTVCAVVKDDERHVDYFIQLSESEHAQWEPMSLFLGFVFKDRIHDPSFLEECLEKYKEMAEAP